MADTCTLREIDFEGFERSVGTAQVRHAGPMTLKLRVRSDDGARFMAGAECVGTERAETIHEFLHHVKEYECLLVMPPKTR